MRTQMALPTDCVGGRGAKPVTHTWRSQTKMKSAKALLSMGALAGIIAFGVFASTASAAAPHQSRTPGRGTAAAAPQDPHPIRVVGRVGRVGTDVFTLVVRNGMTATVHVSDSTWIFVPQNGSCVQGTLSDIQAGRPAAVAGMTTNQRGDINPRTAAQ